MQSKSISSVFDDFFREDVFHFDRKSHLVTEESDGLTLEVEVPGCSKDDLEVELEGKTIFIEIKKGPRKGKQRYLLSGRYSDDIEVNVEYGLLTLRLRSMPRKKLL